MSDAKYFQKGKVQELRLELLDIDTKKDPRNQRRRIVLKKIVANMTMGNDMSALFPDVIACMQIADLEIKKMVYLYLINYAKSKPDLVLMAVNSFLKDATDSNPLIRALAIRTMGYINVDRVIDCLCEPLRAALKDTDPYVRKTAAICIPKLFFNDRQLVLNEGLLDNLKALLTDSNPTVVANAIAGLIEIHEKSDDLQLQIDMNTASNLASALSECSEWAQTYIMEAFMFVTPQQQGDAESLIDRIAPRLQHANSAVVLTAVKALMYLLNFCKDSEYANTIYKKMAPPLVTLVSGEPELQYVALRNIALFVQKRPDLVMGDMKAFFCRYNDPIYVKLSKLDIMFRIVNESNVDIMLAELKEYAAEVDVDFVRKAVRSIGRCAVKIEPSADKCIQALVELIQTKVNYVVQEAIIVIKDVFRKYPNRYESIISVLCENLDNLDEPEAKAAMVWIIGQYADRIENSADLLENFIEGFLEETVEVQLALLTATVKLFIKRPNDGKTLVPKVLKWATEETENPDVRDRGYIYWRLLSTDPVTAKAIVLSEQPPISTETDNLDPQLLSELLLHISSLASIYQKPPRSLFPNLKQRSLQGVANVFAPAPSAVSYSSNLASTNAYSIDAGNSNARSNKQANLLDLDFDEPTSPPPAIYSPPPVANIAPAQQQQKQQQQVTGSGMLDFVGQLGQLDLGGTVQSTSGAFVAPKKAMLLAANARGMEIHGTFARRQGQIVMEMTVTNKAMQPLGDFAIQFNKNTFGVLPAGPLQIRSPLPAGQSAECSLPLAINPLTHSQPTLPVNQLQVAVKNSVGVFFFQTAVPLHILTREDGALTQNDFLSLWRGDGLSDKAAGTINDLSFPNVDELRKKLALNNLFTVAERQVDDRYHIYLSATMMDGTPFLVEVQAFTPPQGRITTCAVAVKTALGGLAALYLESVGDILGHKA